MAKPEDLELFLKGIFREDYHRKVIYIDPDFSRAMVNVENMDVFKEIARAAGTSGKWHLQSSRVDLQFENP